MEIADYMLQNGGKMQTVELLTLYGAIHNLFNDGNGNTIQLNSVQSAACDYLFMIYSLKVKNASEYIKNHIFELPTCRKM